MILFAAGCDAWLTKPSLYNTVTVIVVTRGGQPIPGVALTLYTGQRPMGYATTDTNGRHDFHDVPQGNYGVFAIPPDGYVPIEQLLGGRPTNVLDGLQVANDTLSPVRFAFLKVGPGTMVVRVTQTDGSPMAGVPVTAYSPTAVNAKATTDASGRASLPNIPFGIHGVLVERPLLFRDFRTPGDSLYSFRDNIIVDAGSRDTTTIRLTKCAGTLRALVVDGAGAPVPNTTAVFYTSTQQLAVAVTGPDGRVSLPELPCATQFGILITPPAGYTVADGRGSRFIDGLTVTGGATVDVTFRVSKAP
jgi:hypothetical protein